MPFLPGTVGLHPQGYSWRPLHALAAARSPTCLAAPLLPLPPTTWPQGTLRGQTARPSWHCQQLVWPLFPWPRAESCPAWLKAYPPASVALRAVVSNKGLPSEGSSRTRAIQGTGTWCCGLEGALWVVLFGVTSVWCGCYTGARPPAPGGACCHARPSLQPSCAGPSLQPPWPHSWTGFPWAPQSHSGARNALKFSQVTSWWTCPAAC